MDPSLMVPRALKDPGVVPGEPLQKRLGWLFSASYDSLAWRPVPRPVRVIEEPLVKQTGWQATTILIAPIVQQQLGWLNAKSAAREIEVFCGSGARSPWAASFLTLARVRDQLGWRIIRNTYSDPEVLNRYAVPEILNPRSAWKPWMYAYVQPTPASSPGSVVVKVTSARQAAKVTR